MKVELVDSKGFNGEIYWRKAVWGPIPRQTGHLCFIHLAAHHRQSWQNKGCSASKRSAIFQLLYPKPDAGISGGFQLPDKAQNTYRRQLNGSHPTRRPQQPRL